MKTQLFDPGRKLVRVRLLTLLILAVLSSVSIVRAQTSTFTYPGRFTDGGTAANGTYDMQFKLFDASNSVNQIGATITNNAVSVSGGVFTVLLDFGASGFSGADRFLEISVKPAGDVNPNTTLSPRQQLTSAVYAIRAGSASTADAATNATNATNATTAATATNANQLGGIAANQYALTSDSRLSDARTPTAGSPNYIQNSTNPQAASNFNISANGLAGGTLKGNLVNSTTEYDINGQRVLKAESHNTFVGLRVGMPNPASGAMPYRKI